MKNEVDKVSKKRLDTPDWMKAGKMGNEDEGTGGKPSGVETPSKEARGWTGNVGGSKKEEAKKPTLRSFESAIEELTKGFNDMKIQLVIAIQFNQEGPSKSPTQRVPSMR
jgi:hypothetical protein